MNAKISFFSPHKKVRYLNPKNHQQKPLHHPSKSTGLWHDPFLQLDPKWELQNSVTVNGVNFKASTQGTN